MAKINMSNRLTLFSKELIDSNLELDYLSNMEIDFSTFKTQEFQFTVHIGVIGRPDLLSYQVYNNVNFWWLIALRNDILDPFDDLSVGDTLFIGYY